MNKLLKIVVPLLVLFIAALTYTRPQTIEQRWELPDFSECSQISGRYYIYDEADGHDKVDTEFVITTDDPAFDELLGLVKEAGFKTRLRNLLPSGTKYHSYREGDFRWEVYLYFDEPVELPSGSTVSGARVEISNFFGDLTIYWLDDDVRVSVSDKEQWLTDVLELIK